MFDENNQVMINGEIISVFSYSHEVFGEGFYMVFVKVHRLSGATDIIPVMVSERILDVNEDCRGCFVEVNGQFRSFNRIVEKKNKLELFVFAKEFYLTHENEENVKTNQIVLDGYICKKPIYRKTSLGREISDLLLAVNRPYGKSDHIPCVAWGRNAKYSKIFGVGTRVKFYGRIQSREYIKKFDDGTQETRTAYEVSVSRIDTVESEENEDGSRSEENL